MDCGVRRLRRAPAGREPAAHVAPGDRRRRGRGRARSRAEPARARGARRDPRRRGRRAPAACALLAAGARPSPRRLGCGNLGRPAGRLEATSRPVPRSELVAVRPLRGRSERKRARRARARRRRPVDARAAGRSVSALDRVGDGHADRVSGTPGLESWRETGPGTGPCAPPPSVGWRRPGDRTRSSQLRSPPRAVPFTSWISTDVSGAGHRARLGHDGSSGPRTEQGFW